MDRTRLLEALRGVAGLRLAYLFGSRAKGSSTASSDVDVAILVAPPLSSARELDVLQESLSEAAGAEVDLVDLRGAPPLLRMEIVRGGDRLVVKDDAERTAFEARTMLDYMDTAHLRSIQHRYLRERAGASGAR